MKKIHHIVMLVAIVAQYAVAEPSSQPTRQATLDHLRETGTSCDTSDLWKRSLEKYFQVHDVYVCAATSNAIVQTWDTNHPPCKHYRQSFTILRDLKGTHDGLLRASYRVPEDRESLSTGDKVIMLGRYDKLGFVIITWWPYSDETLAAVETIIRQMPQQKSRAYR